MQPGPRRRPARRARARSASTATRSAPPRRPTSSAIDDDRVEVRHPLLRSTIYHARQRARAARRARGARRRRSPTRAAAPGTWRSPRSRPTRRSPPRSRPPGIDARTRGGSAAAAAAFERAAELSVDDEPRARRQLEAARDLAVAGGFERALTLIDDGDAAHTRDPLVQADLRRARGHVELRRGAPRIAFELLDAEARRIQDTDPARAAETLIEASVAHMMTGDMDALEDAAARACALAGGGVHPALEVVVDADHRPVRARARPHRRGQPR